MADATRFRIQAGSLVFDMEGSEDFVKDQVRRHQKHIKDLLKQQAKIIQNAEMPVSITSTRGSDRPSKRASEGGTGPRRPGRQPVIVRESNLKLKASELNRLKKFLKDLSRNGALGKDSTVFSIAYFLCTHILKSDKFSAGDVIVTYDKLKDLDIVPAPQSVDVIQMLRNLAAKSIGKEWVTRNEDGTFALTAKGKQVGRSGNIIRPRGRRPGQKKAAAKTVSSRVSKKSARRKSSKSTRPSRRKKS